MRHKITLKIHEREIEFNFGLAFIGDLLDELDLSMEEIVKKLGKNPFKMVPTIMFSSAVHAKARQGEEIDFNITDLSDWIDESGGLGQESISKFVLAFTDSLKKDVPKEEPQGNASKKKMSLKN